MENEKNVLFQNEMIAFWHMEGRHLLPWRQTRDPWKLLIAEVLLRKTTAAQAEVVYLEMAELTAADVLAMPRDKLEAILFPLGMSSVKAEQLQEMAGRIVSAKPEELWSDEFLRSMRGVGRYISNSVRCCAFEVPVPALDTNMIRIIERVFGWQSDRSRAREDKRLWEFAEQLVPQGFCREYNWGVLDFGAAVCTHRNPKCLSCPINDICCFYQDQNKQSAQ